MLLSHGLLHLLGVLLDMHSNTLVLNDEKIPVETIFKDGKPAVARVSLTKRVVVPPNSAVRLPCKMDTTLDDYYIEPGDLVMKRVS